MPGNAEAVADRPPSSLTEVRAARGVEIARRAQPAWQARPVRQRLEILGRFRALLAARGPELAQLAAAPSRAEALSAQIIPLAEACRFLERRGAKLLAPRRERRGRPLWLTGCALSVHREPFGVVLVIAPGNYPVLLPGVQTLQALAAGNAVVLKPGQGGGSAARWLARNLGEAGLPQGLLTVLDEAPEAAREAINSGVDKVLLTGSNDTGRELLAALAPDLVPGVLELSGCDPVLVGDDADLELTAAALAFGLRLNGGATCIAPRRVLVAPGIKRLLEARLAALARELPGVTVNPDTAARVHQLVLKALDQGARLLAGSLEPSPTLKPLVLTDVPPRAELLGVDLMAPVLSLLEAQGEQALELAADGPYALGATIFSRDVRAAQTLAARLPAGLVIINDMIVPSADPRLPFAGRRMSGYGVTRGAEGLLELTRPKAVVTRRGGRPRHLAPPLAGDEALFSSYLAVSHGRGRRLGALLDLFRALLVRIGQERQSI